jgi:hypothetical protein
MWRKIINAVDTFNSYINQTLLVIFVTKAIKDDVNFVPCVTGGPWNSMQVGEFIDHLRNCYIVSPTFKFLKILPLLLDK